MDKISDAIWIGNHVDAADYDGLQRAGIKSILCLDGCMAGKENAPGIERTEVIELIDGSGKTVGTARTDFDGFFLFERVPYGDYRLRVSAASASAAGIVIDLGVSLKVTTEHSIVRLGSIQARLQPRIAAADVPKTGS